MAIKRKRSKYGVDISAKGKIKRTYNNVVFDSETEMRFMKEYLEPRMRSGEIVDVKRQVRYVLIDGFKRKNGCAVLPINYVSDFDVTYADGRFVVYDVKGNPDNMSLLKRKLFWNRYPDIDLVFICRNLKWGSDSDGWIPYDALKKIRQTAKKK